MRAACLIASLTAVILAVPPLIATQGHAYAAPAHHRHLTRLRHARYARPFHIPRFDQGEAEAYVHTVYPYRTGLYVPWPDAYGAPYPY